MEEINKEKINDTFMQYEGLVCDECKERMRPLGKKIADALNEGKPPRMRDVIKLQGCLCGSCTRAIYNKKFGG